MFGDAARELFMYNRENFFFDGEIGIKQKFKSMDMRVNRYGQWREDIRDLAGLTVMKMDKYLILNTLMLGFTIVLWCEGRLDIQDHQWLLWLYMLCIGGSFVFLLLSIWLSIHASVVAQSFMVRLLTQHVRLPVPLQEEVSAARPYSNKFEKGKAPSANM